MPLTKKGAKIQRAMKSEYGAKKGEQVFYASINKGTVTGAEKKPHKYQGMTSPPPGNKDFGRH